MNDLVRNQLIEEDEISDLRPTNLASFTGQPGPMENLSVFIRAARRRDEALDHTLFYGPPGLGKTTLSRIIAGELGVGFRGLSAPAIAKPGDLASVLVKLSARDVLFIDEIHRLPLIVEELLYSAMEDFRITIMVGADDNSGEPVEVPIPPFTLVGATTRKGMLSQPLLDRFGMTFRMEYYPDSDLARIIQNAGRELGEFYGDDEAMEIAKRSRGTPRIAIRMLKRLRDFREDAGVEYTLDFIRQCLDALGVSEDGFDELDMRYLTLMRENFRGGPVGIETLASSLSESRDTLESTVEPFLIRKGVLAKTPRGRMLIDQDALLG